MVIEVDAKLVVHSVLSSGIDSTKFGCIVLVSYPRLGQSFKDQTGTVSGWSVLESDQDFFAEKKSWYC